MAPELHSELYKGVAEAMTNARHHAYIDVRNDGFNIRHTTDTPWWMFSQVRDGRLTVAIADLGIGIPATLPLKQPTTWKSIFNKLGRLPRDGEAIEAAVSEGQSRLGKKHRGRGLGQIVRAVEVGDNGRIIILSNRGYYQRRDGQSVTGDHKTSIQGTLICWSTTLKKP